MALGLQVADRMQMQLKEKYDVAIAGGGLAGLAVSILLRKAGFSVIVFEREKYPFHKVCGEYISMESWNFLEGLGIPLSKMDLPRIDTLLLTAPNGKTFTTKLPLGGFGISRFALDKMLCDAARTAGVEILEETKVEDVQLADAFVIKYLGKNSGSHSTSAKACCLAYGKRSNLDVKWKRNFIQQANTRLNNYVGVKYHIKTNWKENVIGLHNFENGYCGISRIEEGNYCLCYMTTAENLKKCNNSLPLLEEKIIGRNPHLQKIFSTSIFEKAFPVTISQISFDSKSLVENHALMLGDAAGMITPLCGNGMSMALHSARLAANFIEQLLHGCITTDTMERLYEKEWKKNFSTRLRTGRVIQAFFGSETLSNFFVSAFKTFPFLATPLIRMTHGKPF
jgi:flavin-dependent dehydrogenase